MRYLIKHLPWSDRRERLGSAIGILRLSNYLCALIQKLEGHLEIPDSVINVAYDCTGHSLFWHPFKPRDLVLDEFSQRVSVTVTPQRLTTHVQHLPEDANIVCRGLGRQHPARLWRDAGASLDLPLQSTRRRAGRAQERIKEIAETRVRYGYRRIHVLLRREGWLVNAKRVYRLYTEMSLQLRNKTPKRWVKAKLREDRVEATQSNETWAMDFVHDQLVTGRKIRVLTIVDTFSRFSPATDPRFSYRSEDVAQRLERICTKIGYPKFIRVDQGSEFVSRDLDLWAYQRGVVLDFSRPGRPTDNAFIESFNGEFRAECLNTRRPCRSDQWRFNGNFMSLDDARSKMEGWRRDYNEVRPHSAIGNNPPITLRNGSKVRNTP